MTHPQPGEALAGQVLAADPEDSLFEGVREHLESVISWARSEQALALEHDQLEEKALTDGYELMRRLTEAHMGLRAAREPRRSDVTGADGKVRITVENGQEHTRVMI